MGDEIEIHEIDFGIPFFKKRNDENDSSKNESPKSQIVSANLALEAESDCYKMTHSKRGKAIVFNHYKFDDIHLSPRTGTYVDVKNIERVLKELKFDVEINDDLKYGEIYDIIQKLAAEDHSENDCLVIVVMTHGDRGVIHARDHQYPPDELWLPFSGNNCPTLAGKPKLFFIQACRGDNLDAGVEMKTRSTLAFDSTVGNNSYTIPAMADFLIMYSTFEGHYSFRSPSSGSWMINCLCHELRNRAKWQDLLTILTFVNRRMAIAYESNIPSNKDFHKKKQVGSIASSLTRQLFFFSQPN